MKEFADRIAAGDLDSPLEMESGNLFGAFTESFDIMREELKAAKARGTELKRKEKGLATELSHDLKTPITSINTICDVLSLKVRDKYVLDKVKGIQKKTRQECKGFRHKRQRSGAVYRFGAYGKNER